MSEDEVRSLWEALEATPDVHVTVDLGQQTVISRDRVFSFSIDQSVRQRLLDGVDDIDMTLKSESKIARLEKARPAWMPRTLPSLE